VKEAQTSQKSGQDLRSRIRREIIGVIVHVDRKHEIHILALAGKEKCITLEFFDRLNTLKKDKVTSLTE